MQPGNEAACPELRSGNKTTCPGALVTPGIDSGQALEWLPCYHFVLVQRLAEVTRGHLLRSFSNL